MDITDLMGKHYIVPKADESHKINLGRRAGIMAHKSNSRRENNNAVRLRSWKLHIYIITEKEKKDITKWLSQDSRRRYRGRAWFSIIGSNWMWKTFSAQKELIKGTSPPLTTKYERMVCCSIMRNLSKTPISWNELKPPVMRNGLGTQRWVLFTPLNNLIEILGL